ncbi:MAG: circadian clock KaiB family protein [Verrucomicrobiota bacterium]|nr:circadian clock KaiB family protein [Verrucomicrobiota bacterium]
MSSYRFKLFIKGGQEGNQNLVQRLNQGFSTHLTSGFELEVVDIDLHPEELEKNHVLAVPMLIKCEPQPLRRLIGDFTNIQKILISIGIMPEQKSNG